MSGISVRNDKNSHGAECMSWALSYLWDANWAKVKTWKWIAFPPPLSNNWQQNMQQSTYNKGLEISLRKVLFDCRLYFNSVIAGVSFTVMSMSKEDKHHRLLHCLLLGFLWCLCVGGDCNRITLVQYSTLVYCCHLIVAVSSLLSLCHHVILVSKLVWLPPSLTCKLIVVYNPHHWHRVIIALPSSSHLAIIIISLLLYHCRPLVVILILSSLPLSLTFDCCLQSCHCHFPLQCLHRVVAVIFVTSHHCCLVAFVVISHLIPQGFLHNS